MVRGGRGGEGHRGIAELEPKVVFVGRKKTQLILLRLSNLQQSTTGRKDPPPWQVLRFTDRVVYQIGSDRETGIANR